MCLDCGCLDGSDRHGTQGHITLKRLQKAADASGLPLGEVAWNIPRTLATGQDGPGSPLANRPAVIFDCDGILAFTAESLCTALNAKFGTTYSPQGQTFFPGTFLPHKLPGEQSGWLADQIRLPAFAAACAPDFHALDCLRDAWDAGFTASVVTERAAELQDVTTAWLADWGAPPVPVHAVGHGQKPEYLAARYGPGYPAVLIDDNPVAGITIARPGIDVWQPQRSYTPTVARDHVRTFTGWPQVRGWLGLGPQA